MAWQSTRGGGPAAAAGVHAAILPPPGVLFSSSTDQPLPLAVSPDGTLFAFCARNGEGPDMLWVRTVAVDDARAIAGTEGAEGPFFSPDGRNLGFFADGKLKRVDTGGGAVITVAENVDPRGGTWGAAGVILYGSSTRGPLWQVSADGGAVTAATVLDTLNGENTHRYPTFLPDGKRFLYLARRSGAGSGRAPTIYLGSLEAPQRTAVLEVASNVSYASGHLLYIREGVLMAQAFDPEAGATSGAPVPLVDDARMDERFSRGVFATSANGVLVCMTGRNQTSTQLQWLDRSGRLAAEIGEPADFTYGGTPELSPDGSRAVMPIANRDRGTSDVWLIDLGNGQRSRLTIDPFDHPSAIWLPDGQRVLTVTNRGPSQAGTVDEISIDGTQSRHVTATAGMSVWPRSVSPDGREVLCDREELIHGRESGVEALPMVGEAAPVVIQPVAIWDALAQFAPDGRCYAYQSSESGRSEVYVAQRVGGGKWQVSQGGGREPRWRDDGRELFYVGDDNVIVAVEIDPEAAGFAAGRATKLFPFHGAGGNWRYDVSRDGQRFLVTRALPEDLALPVTIITDWPARVAKR